MEARSYPLACRITPRYFFKSPGKAEQLTQHRQHTGGWSERGCISQLSGFQLVESRQHRAFFSTSQLQYTRLHRCGDDLWRYRRCLRVALSPVENIKRLQKLAPGFGSNSANALHRDRRGKSAPPLTMMPSACDLNKAALHSRSLMKPNSDQLLVASV